MMVIVEQPFSSSERLTLGRDSCLCQCHVVHQTEGGPGEGWDVM